MKVVDNRKERKKEQFGELPIGQVYIDIDGCFAIKTGFGMADNCITLYNKSWGVYTECLTDEVTPIEATLTID